MQSLAPYRILFQCIFFPGLFCSGVPLGQMEEVLENFSPVQFGALPDFDWESFSEAPSNVPSIGGTARPGHQQILGSTLDDEVLQSAWRTLDQDLW